MCVRACSLNLLLGLYPGFWISEFSLIRTYLGDNVVAWGRVSLKKKEEKRDLVCTNLDKVVRSKACNISF